MSRSLDIHYFSTQRYLIPAGLSLGILITQESNQLSFVMKYWGGGSLLVFGVTYGVAFSANDFLTAFSNMAYYQMLPNESISIDGPTRFYLAALGSTATVDFIRGKTGQP